MLGRSACLRPDGLGVQRDKGRSREGKSADHMATRVDEDGFGGEACNKGEEGSASVDVACSSGAQRASRGQRCLT